MKKGQIYNAIYIVYNSHYNVIGLRVLEENAKSLAEEYNGSYIHQIIPDLV